MKIPFKLPHKAEDRNRVVGPIIGFAMAAIFSLLFLAGAFRTIANFGLDTKFKLRQSVAKIPVNRDIYNVMIDDETLNWEGTYPDDPNFYVEVINGLGKDKLNALATLFSIDYSRPFGRKVDVDMKPIIADYLSQVSQIIFQDAQLKAGMIDQMKYYEEMLQAPDAASYAQDIAGKLQEMVFDEQLGNSSAMMEQVAGFARQIEDLRVLAPDREKNVAEAARNAKNVYFSYEAKNYIPGCYSAEQLKNNTKIRSMFERVLGYPTRNRPEDPREGTVYDSYQNFLLKDYDYLLSGAGKPFKGAVAERIRSDRKAKADELAGFHRQNDHIAFDIPRGLEKYYVRLNRVKPVVPEIGGWTAGEGPRKAEFSADDGTLRMIAPVFIYDGRMYPHIDFLLAMRYLKVKPEDVVFQKRRIILKNATLPKEKKKRDLVIPLLPGGAMLINWAGVWADTSLFSQTNFHDIYANIGRYKILERGRRNENIPPEQQTDPLDEQELEIYSKIKPEEAKGLEKFVRSLKNKIVIIALTAEGTADMNPTPLEPRYKIMGLHANAINTIVGDLFILPVPKALVILLFFVLAAGLGYAGGAVRHKNSFVVAIINFLLMVAVAMLYFTVCNLLFVRYRIDLPLLEPIGLIVLTFLAVFLYRFFTEEQEKKKMKGMFSTYVNPQVVDTLLADPDKLKLGGEKTHATVFFSDIAGFTSISESLTPEALVELLNEYLTAMTGILFSYGGTLDKYIGDAVVGIFGAPIHFPEHAKNGCFCGLDMQAKIAEMRKVWKEQGRHQLQVRAGINTGDMIAGNMGSTKRFNYTVMGPEVDFGEHMESSGKLYNTQLTISEFTRAEADEHIITRFLDITRASAYPKPVKIYELLAKKSDGLPDNKMECAGLHSEGAALFFQRRFDEALAKLRKIHEIIPPNPEDEVIKKFLAPADKFIKRIEEAVKNPPDESFDTLIAEATHRKDLIF